MSLSHADTARCKCTAEHHRRPGPARRFMAERENRVMSLNEGNFRQNYDNTDVHFCAGPTLDWTSSALFNLPHDASETRRQLARVKRRRKIFTGMALTALLLALFCNALALSNIYSTIRQIHFELHKISSD